MLARGCCLQGINSSKYKNITEETLKSNVNTPTGCWPFMSFWCGLTIGNRNPADLVDLHAGHTPEQMLSFEEMKTLVGFESYLGGADPT
jgi:hypothetical protein